jgi:uncharacterized membrane protein required for colicin V production
MTPYDIGMAAVILGGIVWGAWRGITWQVASIASLVLGYVGAIPISASIAPYLPGEPLVARGLALLLSYVGVSLGIFMIAWSIRATLRRMRFEAYDRHLGMVLGGVEGLIIGLVVTIVILSVKPDSRAAILGSPSGKLVDRGLRAARPAVPAELRASLEPVWDVLDGKKPDGLLIGDRDSEDLGSVLPDELKERGSEIERRAVERIGRAVSGSTRGNDGNSGTTGRR